VPFILFAANQPNSYLATEGKEITE
jgi:hypothetical protein